MRALCAEPGGCCLFLCNAVVVVVVDYFSARPETPNFLLTTFPNIPLNDKGITIRDAQLEDAAITQKPT
jgi:hypothetical protein